MISKGDGLIWIKRKHYFERELDTERRHLATKADLIEVSAGLQAQVAVLKRDLRWGLLLLTIIAAGEWLPQIRSLF